MDEDQLLTFGNELLDGRRIDTNTAWLGRKLSLMGFPPPFDSHPPTIVREDLVHAFASALHRSDIIISTGGLGPTQDDLTFEALGLAIDSTAPSRETFGKTSKLNLRAVEYITQNRTSVSQCFRSMRSR